MALAELITIGNEILDGRVLDTNRLYLGRRLRELGYEIQFAQSVDDDLTRIVAAIRLAGSRSDLIVCTGGLGPTSDDLTAEAVSKFLNCEWEINADAEQFLRELFRKRSRTINEFQLKQAKLPKLCRMIANTKGTAPGFFYEGSISGRELRLFCFPGVPAEMHAMFEESLGRREFQQSSKKDHSLRKYTWSTALTSEGDLQERVASIIKKCAPFHVSFRTQFPENHVSLMGRVESEELENKWESLLKDFRDRLGSEAYHEGTELGFVNFLTSQLRERRARLLFVESCTGGLLSHLTTEISGASEVFWGSQVCYSNQEKIRLGVDRKSLDAYGAVSKEVALEMARGGLKRLEGDPAEGKSLLVAVSTSGIAGPSGGSDTKPVGLMYTAVAGIDLATGQRRERVEKVMAPLAFERSSMKLYFAYCALELLRVTFLMGQASDSSTIKN